MACPLCDDRRVLVDDDGTRRSCPFHDGATLVAADPAAVEAIRAQLLDDTRRREDDAQRRILEDLVEASGGMPGSYALGRDWTRQHQLEPAGLTTPTRYDIDVPLRRLPPRGHPRRDSIGAALLVLAAAGLAWLVLSHLAGWLR